MSQERPKNIAASVHQRIVNLARARNSDTNLLFTRYGLERFLYRLSRSRHADSFVLKGAMLFYVWTGTASRPTRDLDLLALSRNFAFTGSDFVSSLAATFRTRDTPIPADIPLTDGWFRGGCGLPAPSVPNPHNRGRIPNHHPCAPARSRISQL